MIPSAEDAARDLLAKVQAYGDLFGDPTVISYGRARARERMLRAADRFASLVDVPVAAVMRPWSPWHGITRS